VPALLAVASTAVTLLVEASAAANLTAASMALDLARPSSTMVAASAILAPAPSFVGSRSRLRSPPLWILSLQQLLRLLSLRLLRRFLLRQRQLLRLKSARPHHPWLAHAPGPGMRLIIRCGRFPRTLIRLTYDRWPQRGSARAEALHASRRETSSGCATPRDT
jgi:hypothetical protein